MKSPLLILLIFIFFVSEGKRQAMLTIGQVYDYNINDEFHYHKSNATPNATRFTIVGKYFSSMNDTVFYLRQFDNYYTEVTGNPNHPINTFFNSYTDTIFYTDLDTLINAQFQNWPIDTNGNWFYDTIYYSSLMCGRLIYEYNACTDCLFEGSSFNGQYGQGIGLVMLYTQSPTPQFDMQNFLIYYKKDSIECGTADTTVITNIESSKTKNDLLVFPNPASNVIKIDLHQPNTLQYSTVSIYSINGQLLLQQPITDLKTKIDISNLAKGVYILKLKSDEGIVVERIVKK